MITEHDATELILRLRSANIGLWLDGGWGVDALLGRQTREHEDLDLFVQTKDADRCVALLGLLGFQEVVQPFTTEFHTAWADGRGRIIDLHLFAFGVGGEIRFGGASYPPDVFSGKGEIGGVEIGCITARRQVEFHLGYAHDRNDALDVRALCERFHLPVPEAYRDEIACLNRPETP